MISSCETPGVRASVPQDRATKIFFGRWDRAARQDSGGADTRSDPGDRGRRRRRSSLTCPASGTRDATSRRRGSSGSELGGAAAAATVGGVRVGGGDGVAAAWRLNGRITELHSVRAEPIRDAAVVGFLTPNLEVGFQVRMVGAGPV